MRAALSVLAACAVGVATGAPSFKDYVQQQGKQYSLSEFVQRQAVYQRNLAIIERLNKEGHSFTAGVNQVSFHGRPYTTTPSPPATLSTQFTDWTPEEIAGMKLPRQAHPEFEAVPVTPMHANEVRKSLPTATPSPQHPPLPPQPLPASFDWRNASTPVVTPVSNQGSVGSCWAFSTVENIAGQWAMAGKGLVPLSAEYLVDCDYMDCSVFGGWPYLAYQFIEKAGGVPTAASHPYCSGDSQCYPCMVNPNTTFCGPPPPTCNATYTKHSCDVMTPSAVISGWSRIAANETAIQAALVARGPISVLMDASGLTWYSKGVWNPTGWLGCSSDCDSLDHAVLLVGYGTDAASGLPYWIVQNSWGASWGENGFFRLARGFNRCAIDCQATTAEVA